MGSDNFQAAVDAATGISNRQDAMSRLIDEMMRRIRHLEHRVRQLEDSSPLVIRSSKPRRKGGSNGR